MDHTVVSWGPVHRLDGISNVSSTDFYQIVALSEPLPAELLTSKPQPSREQVAEKIQGKVLGWGLWVGSYERTW